MKKEYYPSLKLDLGKVSYYLQKLISEILNRNIVCAAKVESNDFWGVCIVNTRLSLSDLKLLLSFVNLKILLKRLVKHISTNACELCL